MSFSSSIVKVGGPVAAGAGVVLLAPVVMPLVGRVLRPVIKTTIMGALIGYDALQKAGGRIKEMTAETVEALEDLAAEAREEAGVAPPKPAKKAKKAAAKAEA